MNFSSSDIPQEFAQLLRGRPPEPSISGDHWLRGLPRIVQDMVERWDLTLLPEGPWFGQCALVLPCRRAGEPAVLKVTWPHEEAATEHLALRAWDGRGAVRLLAADPARYGLLLERLDATRDLSEVDLLEACEVIGTLFTELDRPAIARIPTLSDITRHWIRLCDNGSAAVPRRLTEQAASAMTDLVSHPGVNARLVHQDLHFENVLAARRQPWLAIDPKPVAGEWEFAVAPAIWNRGAEAAAASNLRAHLRLRAGIVCEAAGLDEDRALAWSFVRLVINAIWAQDDPATVTRFLAAAKAMTD